MAADGFTEGAFLVRSSPFLADGPPRDGKILSDPAEGFAVETKCLVPKAVVRKGWRQTVLFVGVCFIMSIFPWVLSLSS